MVSTIVLNMGPGNLLTLDDYGRYCDTYLDGIKLEMLVSQHLETLGVNHFWINRQGEANQFPDILVYHDGEVQVDCKGSSRYYGSMFLGLESFEAMESRRRRYGPIWYVLNDLSVVEFEEVNEGKERKAGGYRFAPERPRSISQWLEEIGYEVRPR